MSAENFLNAETETFGGIIKGDNKFKVPLYQRDYSWSKSNWNDLWLDIETNRKNDSKHYMGSVVLVAKDKKQYDIIDGQQRLTTLTILILAVVDTLKDLVNKDIDVENNEKRIELLITDFIGKKSLSSLNYENKIELNESNNPFFSTYLTNFRKPINTKFPIKSNKLLFECFNYYKELIKEEIFTNEEDVTSLISFVEYISDSLLFIQITATDDLSAYLIFETLNDRGLDLSVTDLLKNYLFSIMDETDKTHVKNIWDETINHVSYAGFPKFLRHYWMMKKGLIQEKELFKTVKKFIKDPTSAFDLLNSMSSVSEIYAALSDSNHQVWEDEREKKYIRELKLFNVTQCYPLLMNAYIKFDHNDWVSTLRICSVISFRYIIISGLNPNALESKYNDACKSINSGKALNAQDIFKILQPLYVNDEDFERSFESKSIRTKRSSKLARYIIYNIENHLSNYTFDYETDNGSLEHVLPENPSEEWEKEFPKDIEENFIYRIGNFTLLEPEKNRILGNKFFDEKLVTYQTSRYKLSKFFGYQKWNQNNLNQRQKYLSKQAKAIWSLSY